MSDMLHLDVGAISPPDRAEIAQALEAYLGVTRAPRREADFCAICGRDLELRGQGHATDCRYVEARLDVVDLIVNLRRCDNG